MVRLLSPSPSMGSMGEGGESKKQEQKAGYIPGGGFSGIWLRRLRFITFQARMAATV